ncbi:hypothetical protein ACLQ8T_06095 [Glutamicibacter sp. FR1]|uniref:hypothetical protein n=1 Tax=Glutamicibacter sp. FR1 TaxID=3393744 RepID=UPI0039AFBFB9
MSNHNIDRAIELAGKIANAEKTGQPNLAALYEANMVQAIADARREVAAERLARTVQGAINVLMRNIRQILNEIAAAFGIDALSPAAQAVLYRQSDFALVGPGSGSQGGTR